MRLSTAKDKVLKSLIQDSNCKHSTDISKKLNIPHYLVTAALLEMRDEKRLSLIETSVSGTGGERTYIVTTIEGAGKHFYETRKSYRWESFRESVTNFIKHFWVIIAFIISGIINIYQNYASEKQQTEKKKLELQLKQLQDSLRNSKK